MEIRRAEAPQFSDPHSAYLAFTCETLECLGMDLQQCRGFARIEESLEMRERLAGWSCFVYLAHKTPYSESRDRAEITASSEGRLWRPTSFDRFRVHSLLGWR